MISRLRILLGLLLALILSACASTPAIRGEGGKAVADSIAAVEDVKLGGIQQRIWIRGYSVKNPVLLVLHGGPGASATGLFRHYNADLEKHFTVVYWDQRGTGRSFSKRLKRSDLTVGKMLADVHELIILLKARLSAEKIFLLGHSWGTILGTLYAQQHPENLAAYIGVSQIASMPKGEALSYQYALDEAAKRGNKKALRELQKIGPPPHSVKALLASRRWVEEFGGAFGGKLDQNTLIWAALKSDEVGLLDLYLFGRGLNFSLDALWPELRALDLTVKPQFAVPVYFFLGRKDRQAPAELAAEHFGRIQAPCKRLVWFEESGHFLPFEENDKFNEAMINIKESGCTLSTGI